MLSYLSRSAGFKYPLVIVLDFARFLDACLSAFSSRFTTTRTFLSTGSLLTSVAKSLVFSDSNLSSASTFSFLALLESSPCRAFFLIFFGIILLKFCHFFGPNVTPPPFMCGALIVPCLARPVPFWRKGFLPPPRTSDLFFT